MFPLWHFAVVALALPAICSARLQHLSLEPSDCVAACIESVYYLHYADSGFKYPKHDPDFYPDSCKSDVFLESVAACSKRYCDKDSIAPGWHDLHLYYCSYRNKTEMDFDRWVHLAEKHGPPTKMRTLDKKLNITGPVIPVTEDFDIAYRTVTAFDYQYSVLHQSFGWAMYLLAAVIFAIGITHRAFAFLSSQYRAARTWSKQEPASEKWSLPALSHGPVTSTRTMWRKYISLPMFFGYRKESPWSLCTIPTRLQGILILFYVFINLLFSFGFISQDVLKKSVYYDTTTQQWWKYISDRTGIIATYNFPLLFALAGRNNIMIWLTGWSYASMNLFHKWASRMAVLQATTHSIGYVVVYYIDYGGADILATDLKARWLNMGLMSIIALLFIIPFAILPLRRASYELFLVLHIILVACALVGLYFHIKIFGRGYANFCWACVGIWAGDRFLRLVRLGCLSTRALTRKTNAIGSLKREGQMIRLEVETGIGFHPKAGTFYHIYFPQKLKFWENHPFTLASWEESSADSPLKLTFLMGVNGGMTGKLARQIYAAQGEAPLSVLLEGPYGRELPVRNYENVLLVAGGSGITAIIPYLWDFRRRAASNDKFKLSTRSVELVWVAKTCDFIEGVMRKELIDAVSTSGQDLDINITVHLTCEPKDRKAENQNPASPISSIMGEKATICELPKDESIKVAVNELEAVANESTTRAMSPHTVSFGRPDMSAILQKTIENHCGGRLAVMICGPTGMMEDMRKAVVNSYGQHEVLTGDNFEYFEESFSW